MKKSTLSLCLIITLILPRVVTAEDPYVKKRPVLEVVHFSDIKWDKLNPARGDQSPQAGTIWGDRNGSDPTGFIFRPSDGFNSPPHIHNVSYRGIVISGLVHNDDPNANEMWMPPGSFWTQPAGHSHITSAKSANTLAYIEIDSGPYLVQPLVDAFDNGERPVNLDKSNITWVDASSIEWLADTGESGLAAAPQIAFLWGNQKEGELRGSLLKFPSGFQGKITTSEGQLRAVVIKGELNLSGENTDKSLTSASYFSIKGSGSIEFDFSNDSESIIYIRSRNKFLINTQN